MWLLRKNALGHNTAIFTMLHLILLTLWFHKIFKLIFLGSHPGLKQWMLNIRENWHRQLSWKIFLYFSYNISVEYLCLVTVVYLNTLLCFQSKIIFNRFSILFIVPPFYFLKRNRFFWALYQSSVNQFTTSITTITTGSVY